MRLREADCRRGRTRFEGGRYRRDGSPATESARSTRRGDTTMRMSDDPALRDYDDYYIGSILRGEGTAFLVDQGILFPAYDPLEHDPLHQELSRPTQIDPC